VSLRLAAEPRWSFTFSFSLLGLSSTEMCICKADIGIKISQTVSLLLEIHIASHPSYNDLSVLQWLFLLWLVSDPEGCVCLCRLQFEGATDRVKGQYSSISLLCAPCLGLP